MSEKTDILSMFPCEVEELCVQLGEPKFRAKQIFSWLWRGVGFEEMSNLPAPLRKKLSEKCEIRLPEVEEKFVSKIDGTIKYLFRLCDGELIESVLMKYKHGNSICISSQVGCRMGCKFCASTIGGKVRDLTASEMAGQVLAAQLDSGERISNIVMMGIGEPLDNYENALRFLKLINHPDTLNIGHRHISLSSCGVADKIKMLADEDLQITLSISLHASNDETRSSIMPVNNKWNIDKLMEACRYYFTKTGRRISFEYTLIAGKNDTVSDARALGNLLKSKFSQSNEPLHVNLIPVNPVEEAEFSRSASKAVSAFSEELEKMHINATVRRRLGSDIDASCGQLRRGAMRRRNETQ
jgi:23S rRNA (adenine2503-C2)-methyltransferase